MNVNFACELIETKNDMKEYLYLSEINKARAVIMYCDFSAALEEIL